MQQHRPAGNSIDAVADDSLAERLARVSAYLMRASRQGTKLDESGAIANRNPAPARCRFEAMRILDHPPAGPLARDLGERHVDHPLLLRDLPGDDGKIIFFDGPCLERLLKGRSGLRGSCKQ